MENDYVLRNDTFPKELNWLLILLQSDISDGDTVQCKPDGMDWEYFLQIAKHHRVYPAVYVRLNALESDVVPSYVLQSLRSYYNNNTFQMLYLSSEMEGICKQLGERHIRSLMLKGPVLAQELYGDVSLRTSKDLDILVSIDDVERAESILVSQGYVVDHEFPRVLEDWKWRFHHISFLHPEKRIQIELHWRLNPDMGKEPGFELLWDRSRVSAITKYPVHFLGKEDLFLFLVSHGARHAWFRLRWITDIDKIVHKGLEWPVLRELLLEYNCTHVGGQALLLVSDLFKTPIDQEILSITKGQLQRKLARNSLIFIKNTVNLCSEPHAELDKLYRKYMYLLRWGQQKWNFIIRRFYPSSLDAEALPLPKALHFLYVPLRPFLWLMRQIKQHSSI
ncbi:nucleotidyltransferase domain-containing protein [Paenibacillus hexagrammi]|uniref:Nucleotidyltransferase family protein n=1 Tax=Paenibacillus hexagrammi TaxID=2908839 RepID=A0ABY3SKB5_9BACL|nr:nucleotidyltransferase family protein [Paenibacillus sp. YPD9-1]UJF34307.1 nucleotidyltransferase family protein [Paenibacillus sp. YPD9-1]